MLASGCSNPRAGPAGSRHGRCPSAWLEGARAHPALLRKPSSRWQAPQGSAGFPPKSFLWLRPGKPGRGWGLQRGHPRGFNENTERRAPRSWPDPGCGAGRGGALSQKPRPGTRTRADLRETPVSPPSRACRDRSQGRGAPGCSSGSLAAAVLQRLSTSLSSPHATCLLLPWRRTRENLGQEGIHSPLPSTGEARRLPSRPFAVSAGREFGRSLRFCRSASAFGWSPAWPSKYKWPLPAFSAQRTG